MRRPDLLLSIIVAASLSFSMADAGPIQDWIAAKRSKGQKDLVASSILDVAYNADRKQRLDVYLPSNPRKAPIIVMVHGGAWKSGDKKSDNVVQNKMHRWVARGAIFVSVNYRLVPKVSVKDQISDVAAALAYVQEHAAEWGGDASKIVLIGHSAGAHLVSMLSVDPGAFASLKPWLGTVSLDTATMDLAETMGKEHFGFYDEVFGSEPSAWEAYSPIRHISHSMVPMLAVCSTLREDRPCTGNEKFAQKARESGVRVDVLPEALSHGEINDELGKEGDYTEKVEEFFRSLGIDLS